MHDAQLWGTVTCLLPASTLRRGALGAGAAGRSGGAAGGPGLRGSLPAPDPAWTRLTPQLACTEREAGVFWPLDLHRPSCPGEPPAWGDRSTPVTQTSCDHRIGPCSMPECPLSLSSSATRLVSPASPGGRGLLRSTPLPPQPVASWARRREFGTEQRGFCADGDMGGVIVAF